MNNIYQIFAIPMMIIIYHLSSYSQINNPNEDPFLYYRFLPFYEKFKNDSDNAALFKRNKVKSVSEYRKSSVYGKYEKEICWEKKEYNRDGFLVKITNPDIKVFRGPTSIDYEDNRIDSTTYSYNKENNSITYICWVRKYPEKTNYFFNELGNLYYVEEFKGSNLKSKDIINYDLVHNRIITIDTNQYFKINGSIFIIADNRISKILDYDDKDTVISEIYKYSKNKLTINKFENGTLTCVTTRYYNVKGELVKEIREIGDKDIIVEEYFYRNNNIKSISYKRDIESSFYIFKSVSKSILYLNNSKLPIYEVTNWHGNFDYHTQFQYEYYE